MEWPIEISEAILYDVLHTKEVLQKQLYPKKEVVVNHTYQSLWIHFQNGLKNPFEEIKKLKNIYSNKTGKNRKSYKKWQIPVCYHPSFGWDLESLSEAKGIPIQELVTLHSQALYTLYFIGFLPGFMYLGGLPEMLHNPRKSAPRTNVPAGSVAIGGSQAGIYPSSSPGGWQLIGKTPIALFDSTQPIPCFANPGDKIAFYEIDKEEFEAVSKQLANGSFTLKSAAWND